MERTPVESNCLLKSIDCFDWSKIFFKLIAKSFLCWFLTCIFFIYWISANWSWNASLGVISNYIWDVYKYYIRICRIKFLFTMSYLVSFGTDCQYMFYMSKVLLKDMIDGVRVPQFQLDYICDKIIFYIRIWLSCVVKCIICGGGTNSCN